MPKKLKSLAPEYINLQNKKISAIKGIDVKRLDKLARILRGLIFAAVEAGQSGHPGSSGKVEQFLAMTLGGVMAFDPMNPKNPGRDRVVWSAGHCTPLLFGGQALYPFMLAPDYDKKAIGITHYLKSGNVAEVYEVAGMTSQDIKEKILDAIK